MHRSAISHSRLMRESTDRIETALHSEDGYEQRVAHRLAESSKTWELWENEHSGLMRQVADYGVLRTQAAALRHTALRLIHGKALFEYLRRKGVRGAERARMLQLLLPDARLSIRGHCRTRRFRAQGVQLSVRELTSGLGWSTIPPFSIRCSTTRICTRSTSISIAARYLPPRAWSPVPSARCCPCSSTSSTSGAGSF